MELLFIPRLVAPSTSYSLPRLTKQRFPPDVLNEGRRSKGPACRRRPLAADHKSSSNSASSARRALVTLRGTFLLMKFCIINGLLVIFLAIMQPKLATPNAYTDIHSNRFLVNEENDGTERRPLISENDERREKG